MKADVAKYMRYYNMERLHSANQDMSPAAYEMASFKPRKSGVVVLLDKSKFTTSIMPPTSEAR